MYEFLDKKDNDIIEKIHEFAIVEVGPKIDANKNQLVSYNSKKFL